MLNFDINKKLRTAIFKNRVEHIGETMNKIITLGIVILLGFSFSGCDNSDTSAELSSVNTSIEDNGITYDLVTSPITNKVWLDRNLGAIRVCINFDDNSCYGDFYQWGRNNDGHQLYTSSVRTTQANDVQNVGHSYFIDANDTFDDDWAKNADADGRIRSFTWSKVDGSSVCPIGFRLPTIQEFQNEQLLNTYNAFESFLKIPSSGRRTVQGDSFRNVVSMIWSSDVDGIYSKAYSYDSSSSSAGSADRALGFTIRCIKD